MPDSLQPQESQHARPPCPSPTPRAYPNLCLLSWWDIQPSHPLLSPSPLSSIFPSITVFSNESAHCIRWPKDWSFSFSISPSNEQPGLISFRVDWLDLLAVQGTLESLLQHTAQKHQFFGAQLSSLSNMKLDFTSHIHTWPLEKP